MEKRLKAVAISAVVILGLAAAGTAHARGGYQEQAQGEQELTGKVASKSASQLYLESEEGVIVPFKLDAQTQYMGERREGKPLASAQQLEEGDEVRVSFSAKGSENSATQVELKKFEGQELSGKVAAIKGNDLIIEHEGAFVPLKVGSTTSFEGENAKGQPVKSVGQIQQGDEVRATFRVKNQKDNSAESIEVHAKSEGMEEPSLGGQEGMGQ